MGKILVILNLVAAVLVGVMLAIHAGTEPNWKAANDQLQQELTASRTNSAALESELKDLNAENTRLAQEATRLKKVVAKDKEAYDDHIETLENAVWEINDQSKEAQAVAKAAQAESGRLGKEIVKAQDLIKSRDESIAKLDDDLRKNLALRVAAENSVNTLKVRLTALVTQLESMSKKLVKLETGGGSGTASRDPNAKNPPAHLVRGVITGIVRDRGLVEVSVGSDDGVNEGHTLEVYRLKPRPEYLGTIKILNADHHEAVGQIMRSDGVRHSPMAKGDEVASRIMTSVR
jgi:hypothetical protein